MTSTRLAGSPPSRARWVPRSPLHAVLACTAVLSVIVGGTWAIGTLGPERTDAPTAAPATASAVPVPVWTDPPAAPVPPDAVATAEAWMRAFVVHPGQSREQWLTRLDPLTTDEYLGLLETEADDTAAPHAVTGRGTAVGGADGSADVDVPTDQGIVRVQLVEDDGRWLVADAGGEGTR